MIELLISEDGSHTLKNIELDECYHSTFGAVQESRQVFIKNGLDSLTDQLQRIKVFEVGFGTGLNAFLAMEWAHYHKVTIEYVSLEAFPLEQTIAAELNYPEFVALDQPGMIFRQLHETKWEGLYELSDYFSILKIKQSVLDVDLISWTDHFNLVFFDAFGPDVQPDLWSEKVFQQMYAILKNNGALCTYSVKGMVKRALKGSGFRIIKLPGPKGKREVLKAIKVL